MSLFAVEQQFAGEKSLIIEAETVVSADGWCVFRNADERPPATTRPAGIGPVEAFPSGDARAHEWSRIDHAGGIRLRQGIVPPPPRNQLFVVMMRRGRTSAVVIEAASAIAIEEQWVFRDAHGHPIAALPAADVSHVETVRHSPERP